MRKKWFAAVAVLSISAFAAGCGGGGGSSLQAPAFTNLAGTAWTVTDTVSTSGNSCGVAKDTQDIWTCVIGTQSGNDLTVYDQMRAGVNNAVPATISGYVVTFHGPRSSVGSCTNMTAAYSLTINGAGTDFSGTATFTCLDNGCTVPVNVAGTKQVN